MIAECPQCHAKYQVADEEVLGRPDAKIQCAKCGTLFPALADAPPPLPELSLSDEAPPGPLDLPPDKAVAISVTAGPFKGTVFPITQPRVVVGRAAADITLQDPEISRQHCAIEVHGEKAYLVDLGSTNGTYMAEQRIESAQLEHSSEFRVGSNVLMFTVTDQH